MAAQRTQRLLYFGMFGPLSRLPLATLLDSGTTVAAVIVPARSATPTPPPIRRLPPPPGWSAQPTSFADLLKQTASDLAPANFGFWQKENAHSKCEVPLRAQQDRDNK